MLSVGTTSDLTVGYGQGRNLVDNDDTYDCTARNCQYVYSDNDIICDNSGKNKTLQNGVGKNYVDADGDGICDNSGKNKTLQNGVGKNYVDTDEDGICDNSGKNKTSQNGVGKNYVDTDEDGICDKYVANYCQGSGGRNKNDCRGICNR